MSEPDRAMSELLSLMTEKHRKVYTRMGDRGETSLLSGERVFKDDLRVKCYGALDELQAQIGVGRSFIRDAEIDGILISIQKDIRRAGTILAVKNPEQNKKREPLTEDDVRRLEDWIDDYTARTGLPNRFVIPGVSPGSAMMHLCRTVCRRCERIIVSVHRSTGLFGELIVYFNRLSDLFFVLAWHLEVKVLIEEAISDWQAGSQQSGAHNRE